MSERKGSSSEIHGEVAEGFEGVRDAFADNFKSRGEVGAAFAATLDGKSVVDLWGGVSDHDEMAPWISDTLTVIFSGTKGLTALCLLMLMDRGEVALDAPVSRYWPEFGTAGKEHVTVADIASHRACLPGVQASLQETDILDDVRMAALLANQPQEGDSRAKSVYHALTFGWLCGELVRQIDGRSIGKFFNEEVAAPLGLDIWIGLPKDLEKRVSTLVYAADWGSRSGWTNESFTRDQLLGQVWNNPPLFPIGKIPYNQSEWHEAEIPGVGGIATARSMARLYGCLACGGELNGVRLLSPATLSAGLQVFEQRWEPLLQEPQSFGVGFQLQTDRHVFGRSPDAFGHAGAGGSLHCAWPRLRMGVSYVMNLLRDDMPVDPRAQALLSALEDAAGKARGGSFQDDVS